MNSKPRNKDFNFDKPRPYKSGFRPDEPLVRMLAPVFTPQQIDDLRQYVDANSEQGALEPGHTGATEEIRRSRICWLVGKEFKWLYQRIWQVAVHVNRKYQFNITEFHDALQVSVYDEHEEGFYSWHMDVSTQYLFRKLSISLPLSDPSEYEGGELEFLIEDEPWQAPQEKGNVVVFPSFMMHRVKPVTRGKRYSLVAWIGGPNWR